MNRTYYKNWMRGLVWLLCFLLAGCSYRTRIAADGFVKVKGGNIWYQVLGKGNKIPLLLIHGGPGGRSCSGLPVYTKLDRKRPVVFYDQLDSGRSDRTGNRALWELSRFVEEVGALRSQLGLEKVHLLGSSWGAAIAIEYLLTQDPEGVASVIFAGPLLGTAKWMEDARALVEQLPAPARDTLKKYEALGRYDHPAYQEATDAFYARFLRRNPVPRQMIEACEDGGDFNADLYLYMWGPTEFNATGTLRTFDRTADLGRLACPVLFITGEFDEARPETMYEFQKAVPGSEVYIVAGAGHSKTVDNPEDYLQGIRAFLDRVESGMP